MNLGGIEAGGTKWTCGVGDEEGRIADSVTFATTTPHETLRRAAAFFEGVAPIDALGVGAFGPVDVRHGSRGFGRVASTPKPGWSHADLLTPLREQIPVPIRLDTDTNAAALGEATWGNGAGLPDFVYITVGTGIGGGIVANGLLVHGHLHPELGHMRVPHDRKRDPFTGACPFHGDCLEGLASGEALRRRCGGPAEEALDESVWELEAEYLAYALINVGYVVAPQRIILGGGVMGHPGLLAMVRRRFREMLGAYPDAVGTQEHLTSTDYIVEPALGEHAGLLGAFVLARELVTRGLVALPPTY